MSVLFAFFARMTPTLTAENLFEAQRAALHLEWLAGRAGAERALEPANARFPGLALVGHLNFVHPNRVQVLGDAEVKYLATLTEPAREAAIESLCSQTATAVVVVADDLDAEPMLRRIADRSALPLLATPVPAPRVIEALQYYLSHTLAAHETLHGVFLEVMGLGVLLTGAAGVGKSELALELLSRGHHLIADDAVELYRMGPDQLLGRCPALLKDFLEVRGLGVLNARVMFGETAVRREKTLRLIVRLEALTPERMRDLDRLQAARTTRRILDVEVPEVALFVAPGRNLAVLVEVAARAHILLLRGLDPAADLIARHDRAMQTGSNPA
jgi:HPr kinase/phosphorylase